MKKPNGEYKEVIVTALEDTGVSKRCFWGHEQAMRYINENVPITVIGYYERDPSHYSREQYPELYT